MATINFRHEVFLGYIFSNPVSEAIGSCLHLDLADSVADLKRIIITYEMGESEEWGNVEQNGREETVAATESD